MNGPPENRSGSRGWNQTSRHESKSTTSIPQGVQSGKVWEDRPNWASCFPPKNPSSRADFTGVTVIDGRRFWSTSIKSLIGTEIDTCR